MQGVGIAFAHLQQLDEHGLADCDTRIDRAQLYAQSAPALKALSCVDDNALTEYAYCCERGYGVSMRLSDAFSAYKRAAGVGNVRAIVRVGRCFERGVGVAPDVSEAVSYYEQGVKRGSPEAMVCLAELYERTGGAESNPETAYQLYRRAAAMGDAEAQYRLGLGLLSGFGVVLDRKAALQQF